MSIGNLRKINSENQPRFSENDRDFQKSAGDINFDYETTEETMPYRGIENLKSADEEVELTQEQLNTLRLCQNDPYLFITSFVQTPSKDGTHILKPSPRQPRAG